MDDMAERKRKIEIAKLELEEAELENRREKLMREKSRAAQVESAAAMIVKFNVGGEKFDASRDTLLRDDGHAYFSRILDSSSSTLMGALRDEDGRIYIERDPRLFRILLGALRGHQINRDDYTAQQRAELAGTWNAALLPTLCSIRLFACLRLSSCQPAMLLASSFLYYYFFLRLQ